MIIEALLVSFLVIGFIGKYYRDKNTKLEKEMIQLEKEWMQSQNEISTLKSDNSRLTNQVSNLRTSNIMLKSKKY